MLQKQSVCASHECINVQTGPFPRSQLHRTTPKLSHARAWGTINNLFRMSVIRGEGEDADGVQVGTGS